MLFFVKSNWQQQNCNTLDTSLQPLLVTIVAMGAIWGPKELTKNGGFSLILLT